MHGIDVNLEKALQCPVNISISARGVEAGIFKAVLLTLGKSFFSSCFPPSCQFSQILLSFGVKYILNGTDIYLGHISTAILHIIVCLALGFCIPICLPLLMLAISRESKSISATSWMFISMKELVMRREKG